MDDLKECPFCESDNLLTEVVSGFMQKLYAVQCYNCGAQGPAPNGTEKEAKRTWNDRPLKEGDEG